MTDRRALRVSPDGPTPLCSWLPRERQALPEVGGERKCWRAMKKSFGQICDHEHFPGGISPSEQPEVGTWSAGREGV